ncbi:MAG TPA: hypothetical protein VNK82_02020 [Terriglobales bacterium]|nr:hypothetical protein [Terriglobales bacterium]
MSRLIFGIALILVSTGLAEEPIKLEATKTTEVSGGFIPPFGIIGTPKCDGKGDIYILAQPARRKPPHNVIMRIAADGTAAKSLEPETSGELRGGFVRDFTVSLTGEVFALVELGKSGRPEVYVAQFSKEGNYSGKTRLEVDERLIPAQIAALPEGGFLISGTLEPENDQAEGPYEPFTGLFDDDGSLISRLDLAGERTERTEESPLKLAIETGSVAAGEDGNLYLMRRLSNPVIHVVAGSGTTVRKFQVAHPSGNFEPILMMSRAGRLLVSFQSVDKKARQPLQIFRIVDPQSGMSIREYLRTHELQGALVCYTGESVTFLTRTKGKLVLLSAEVR